jgi:hypothetical protein
MGAVRCTIHGHQVGGPMACRHLSSDVWAGETTRPFQEFKADFFDDGTLVLGAECRALQGLRRKVWRFRATGSQLANSRIHRSSTRVPRMLAAIVDLDTYQAALLTFVVGVGQSRSQARPSAIVSTRP